MRKWNVLTVLLVMACVVTPAFAQDVESLARKIEALQAQVDSLAADNAELRSSQDQDALEQQINALAERAVANTTVMSKANPVTLTGEFRFRSGWSLGDNADFFSGIATEGSSSNNNEHDGGWTDARVRLGFQYDFTRDVTAYAELQSHWAYGDGAPSSGFLSNVFEGSFSSSGFSNEASTPVVMYQAWLEVRNVFNRPELSSRTGRQEFVKGHQYQFGNADWYNGWVFDGTRWDWDSESFTLTAFAFKLSSFDGDFNQVSSYFTSHDDDELYGLYFTLKTIKNHTLDLYWIYVNGHGGAIGSGSGSSVGSLGNPIGDFFGGGGTTNYFHTIGARIGGVIGEVASGLDWNVEAAYQFGDQKVSGSSSDLDVDGFSVEAEAGLTFDKDHMFRVYVRFLWAEGGDVDSSGLHDTGYIPLYPNRHSNDGFRARYGLFDLIPMANVLTLQGGLHFNPAQEWTLGATFLWATTDEEDLVVSPGMDDDYGIEVDIWGEYRYSENLVFNGGVAILFPDDAGEAIWGTDDDTQLLFYLQGRLTF